MTFHHVSQTATCAFMDALTKSQLNKWDMSKGMQYNVFRYTKYYHSLAGMELATDLFNDPGVQAVLKVLTSKQGVWQPLTGQISHVEVEQVLCSLTRMDLFDKLTDPATQPPIVRPGTGELVRRVDDVRHGVQVTDNLRELLLCEESENADLYSAEEKSELLWRVFNHICLGGPCCQYEDKLDAYLDATKRIYKELTTVQKNANNGSIEVASSAFAVIRLKADSGEELPLFPNDHPNNFLYITMDPVHRLVRVWYHAFIPFW